MSRAISDFRIATVPLVAELVIKCACAARWLMRPTAMVIALIGPASARPESARASKPSGEVGPRLSVTCASVRESANSIELIVRAQMPVPMVELTF
jgi:hypothetical protein